MLRIAVDQVNLINGDTLWLERAAEPLQAMLKPCRIALRT